MIMSCNTIILLDNWHNEKELVTRILNQMEYPGQNLIPVMRKELWLSLFNKEDWQSLPDEILGDLEFYVDTWLGELESQIAFHKTSNQTVMSLSIKLFEMLDKLRSRFNSTSILQPLKRIFGFCLYQYLLSEITFNYSPEGKCIDELYQVDLGYYNECYQLLAEINSSDSLKTLGSSNWVVILLAIKLGSIEWPEIERRMSEAKKEQEEREFFEALELEAAHEAYLDAGIQAYCPYCEISPCKCKRNI